MWNLKYNTNEHIYKTETESQTQTVDLWLPRGRGNGGGKDWEFGMRSFKGGWWEIVDFPRLLALPEINSPKNQAG